MTGGEAVILRASVGRPKDLAVIEILRYAQNDKKRKILRMTENRRNYSRFYAGGGVL